jgi:two-component system alkaline phosphatase synthesis response regulator PhoP
MAQYKILVIEDDPILGSSIVDYLEHQGYGLMLENQVSNAIARIDQELIQLIILDLNLPDGLGFEVLEYLSHHEKKIPTILISAQIDAQLRLHGLELGAQDFIHKPFTLKELSIKIKRIITLDFVDTNVTTIGPLLIDYQSHILTDAHGQKHSLTYKELTILKMLLQKSGEVLSREEIINQIWGSNHYPSFRTIDNYIVTLRKWSSTAPTIMEIISIRGIGYKLILKGKKI